MLEPENSETLMGVGNFRCARAQVSPSPDCYHGHCKQRWFSDNFLTSALESLHCLCHCRRTHLFSSFLPFITSFLSFLPEAAGGCAVKCRTVVEQISVEVNTDVGLEAVGEPLEHHVHVDPVRVRPGVLQMPKHRRETNKCDICNKYDLMFRGKLSRPIK